MAAEVTKEIALEIAHVLFIDIVDYSKFSINEQHTAVDELTQIVRATEQFQKADASERLIKIATGDGMALVFYTSPEAPVRCAIEISRALKGNPRLHVRMGVHSGPVSGIVDVTGRANLAGAGLNIAYRVMTCGDAGHILLSKRTAEDLEEYDEWRPLLHDLGACDVKHGARVGVVSLYGNGVGNPTLPKAFRLIKQRRARHRSIAVAAALIAVGAIIAGAIWFSRARMVPSSNPSAKSIAVLPFENLSRDPENAYFADGVTDSLTTDLAQIHSLRVVSFQSVRQFKGERRKSLPEIARALNVDAVVEGSVQQSADTVMINAQLVQAANDQHRWAGRYTRKTRDLLGVQSEIVRAIADAVKIELTPKEATRLATERTIDPEAQSHYFLGRFHFGQGTEAGFRMAISEYEQAIAKQPNFAGAYAGIASCYSALASVYMPPREAMPLAESAARKAIEIDPGLAEAHAAIGFIDLFYHWNRAEAEHELRKAIELNPNYSTAYLNYGLLLLTESRFDDSLTQLRRAAQLEPTSALISSCIEWALFLEGKYNEVLQQAQHTLSIEPGMAASYSQMGLAYLYLGQKENALAALKKAVEMDYNSGHVTNYAYGLAVSGHKADAERVLAEFLERSKGKYICAYEVASAYEGMNERAKALDWLRRGFDEKCDCLVWGTTEPWMGEIRRDPRYQAILAKAGLLIETNASSLTR
ncbi:MAG TPA: tetratricopeptide repeat protein [Candidatus Udaeobacter sp.]|nr:tetratricopeptide repeat protein [Candidatus Udaeobacter sp.]